MNTIVEGNRREFLTTIVQGGGCLMCSGVMGTLLAGCDTVEVEDQGNTPASVPLIEGDPIITLTNESALENVGGSVKKRFSAIGNGNVIVIIVRLSTSTFAAYDARCTHEGTIIGLPVIGVMTCPRHGSKFNASNGSVVQGPAASPLGKFTATFNSADNTVTIG